MGAIAYPDGSFSEPQELNDDKLKEMMDEIDKKGGEITMFKKDSPEHLLAKAKHAANPHLTRNQKKRMRKKQHK